MYIHFTDAEGAEAIRKSRLLLSSAYVKGVYAVAVGGVYVPSVQQSKHGRATSRDCAVVFTTSVAPDVSYPEEVIWRRALITIDAVEVFKAEEVIELLSDDVEENEE